MRFQLLTLSLLVFILPSTGQAQQNTDCDLSKTSLRQLRLGMTVEEVRRLFPGWRPGRTSTFGELQSTIRAPKSSRSEMWKGVRAYAVNFFEGRAYWIMAVYNQTSVWESPDQFVSTVSEALRLPDQWEVYDDESRSMTCGSNWMLAGLDGNYPFVSMANRAAQERRLQRMKEAGYALQEMMEADRESQRRAFKP